MGSALERRYSFHRSQTSTLKFFPTAQNFDLLVHAVISSTKTKIGLRSFIFPCLEVEVPFTFHHQSPHSYIKVNTCLLFKCPFLVSLELVIVFPWLSQLYHASLRLEISSQTLSCNAFFYSSGNSSVRHSLWENGNVPFPHLGFADERDLR